MRIQHNIMAMNAYRNYTNNVAAMKKNLEKLSSGYKINRAGDDAAGLAISEKMRAQITGLETAQKNAKDGISLVQTAEGALTEVHDMLNRMVELATQSANGTYDNTTDRYQMQKEVNQLLDEINRIADSSNFNGIKLLDGSLGLNTDAFKVEAGDVYTEAVDATTSNLAISNFHGGSSVDAQAPSFTIDLDSLVLTNDGSTAIATGATFATINFGGQDYKLKAAASIGAGSDVDATAVAAALAKAFNTGALGATASKVGSFAGYGFSASAANGKITFTYQGKLTGSDVASADVDAAATAMGSATAAAINAKLGGTVTITAGANVSANGNKEILCDITAPKNAVYAQTGDRPGADIDLAKVIQDGYKIKIDNLEFTIKTDKNSTYTGNVIDVSMHASGDQAKMAAMIIAGGIGTNGSGAPDGNAKGSAIDTTNFHVSYKGGTVIHVDALDAKRGNFKTADKIQDLIKVTTTDQAEKLASTKLTINEAELKDGNTITVGDKKFVYNYDGTATNVTSFTSADDLKTALNDAGYTTTVSTATNGNKVLNIQGKTTDADGKTIKSEDVTAPVVLGKGLTLQIGDTSDAFNQLNVAVQDMHAGSLGIGGLKIDTEEEAQAAINKIKTAINTVSDVRGTLGATQNRLDHTINNLSVMTENIQDAESTIRDVDVAEEMMAYTKNNILIQSAQAMLAQANQVPQGVLQLLQ